MNLSQIFSLLHVSWGNHREFVSQMRKLYIAALLTRGCVTPLLHIGAQVSFCHLVLCHVGKIQTSLEKTLVFKWLVI